MPSGNLWAVSYPVRKHLVQAPGFNHGLNHFLDAVGRVSGLHVLLAHRLWVPRFRIDITRDHLLLPHLQRFKRLLGNRVVRKRPCTGQRTFGRDFERRGNRRYKTETRQLQSGVARDGPYGTGEFPAEREDCSHGTRDVEDE
jgi:hypothetical protein